ncbi:glycosyltransferase family 2 protein [Flavobacterium sp. XS2P12]|uniref:glycosyltransferase family 2 protein n=1 Tax=Flavobacterium melibiosi TaxID=3398734 RepID=UPI003A890688
MASTEQILILLVHYLFFIYSISAIGSYIILAFISAIETKEYMRKNSFVNYKEILASSISPSISIIAPAYNESLNIVENVRSLLSSYYVNYDVIIINDGSIDDSLDKLIKAYNLIQVDYLVNEQIQTKPLRNGIYKSTNPAFEKLIVVDKENGGKADALNMGLNISNNKYVACIDVDCLLLEESLQKMIKPFLETTNAKVIAAGGVIRISNSCLVKDGKLHDVNFPEKLLEKGQILEYLRAFLLGRMAWSRLNGLLVISGAFGLFDKKIAIKVGGYDTKTVGEDMEIVVRMRGYMEEQKEKYKVAYIPDPLCWTEAPDNYKTFISQRNRWTRGTIETLRRHRKIGFNPKYNSLGLLSYPYWFFFERMAPIVEVAGLIYFGILIALNHVRWDYSLAFIILAYLFTVIFSIVAIITEELTYHQYKKKGTGYNLLKIAFLEPFVNHPFILYAAIRGNLDYYFNKKKKWGAMTRKGMAKA